MLDFSYIPVCYFTQRLTELNLEENKIRDEGAQYLVKALRTNTAREKDYA
jgi:hypothetical protein